MKKEEQKQHLIDMMRDDENLGLYENWVEDAEKESSLSDLNSKANIFWSGYRVGVKSKERMYSEEEVYNLLVEWTAYQNGFPRVDEDEIPNGFMSFNQWFEQFKKK
jgi:hypothetical protein